MPHNITAHSNTAMATLKISFSCSLRRTEAGGEWGEAGWAVLAWWWLRGKVKHQRKGPNNTVRQSRDRVTASRGTELSPDISPPASRTVRIAD